MNAGYADTMFGLSRVKSYALDPLLEAFESICKDDMRKVALAESLKQGVVRGKNASGDHPEPTFEDNTFTITQGFDGNGCWPSSKCISVLEEKL